MYNDKLVYNVYIWVLFGIIFGKEKEALSILNTYYLWNMIQNRWPFFNFLPNLPHFLEIIYP